MSPPLSRLARFLAAADCLRALRPDSVIRPNIAELYDQARARLLDTTTAETGPVPSVSADQAAAVLDDAPPTRPSIAPGDPERARAADARTAQCDRCLAAAPLGSSPQGGRLCHACLVISWEEWARLLRQSAPIVAPAAEVPPARVALLEALERAARAWWSQDAAESPIGDALRALEAEARASAQGRG